MKITKVILTIILSLTAITGITVSVLGILTYTQGITLTNVQSTSFSPTITKFSLVISKPISTEKVNYGDLLVLGASSATPQIGQAIDYETNKNHYIIRAYANTDHTDVISYGTAKNVNKVAFAIPVLGLLTSLLHSPIGVFVYVIFVTVLVSVYYKLFYQKKPKKERPVIKEDNQIVVLKEIFDDAPPYTKRSERKRIIKEQKLEEKARKKEKINA